jgi:arylsulfatase A-like enzyme
MEKPNILLLSADSLGANHIGCYGYARATTPELDALASEGVQAERMFCPAIPTLPSYTTLYTGQHAITHQIVSHPCSNELDREAPFLPWLLLQSGYTTCALDSLMRTRLWFGRGYEYYIDPSQRHALLYLAVTCEELNTRAVQWLKAHRDEPFFMFIHYWDTHWPFNPPERYRGLFYEGNATDPENRSLERWWEHPLGAAARDVWLRTKDGLITDANFVTALYDQEIRYLDESVGQLLRALDDLGLAENTLVIFTGDHGESMTEHGIYFDHHGLYDVTLRVPLLARWPGHLPAGARLPHLLQVSDIAPTLLESTGLPVPETMDGRSFWKLLVGCEQAGGHDQVVSLECTWQAKWSLRTDRYKFILARSPDLYHSPPRELYDLAEDPDEARNLADEQRALAARMEAELEGWIAGHLRRLGRTQDPLVAHGVSLGGPWLAARERDALP